MSKRVLQGMIVSDACDKTVIVRVERRVMHPIYKKFVTRSKKYAAHDENNSYRSGDVYAPKIEQTEALKVELEYFIDCFRGGHAFHYRVHSFVQQGHQHTV